MKKLILTAAVAAIFASCGTSTPSISTEKDSVAYAIGLDLGNYIKGLDSTLDVNIISAGIKGTLDGKATISKEDAMAFLQDYFTVRVPARAQEASAKFLADIEKQPNVKKTESGLLYEVVLPGDDKVKPTADTDVVKVVYEGTLKTGVVFDSSKQRGDTASFALNQVIKGWGEGLKLVGKGGKIKLYIPSELGYGAQGAGGVIGPNEALVFEVDLVDVNPAEEAK